MLTTMFSKELSLIKFWNVLLYQQKDWKEKDKSLVRVIMTLGILGLPSFLSFPEMGLSFYELHLHHVSTVTVTDVKSFLLISI